MSKYLDSRSDRKQNQRSNKRPSILMKIQSVARTKAFLAEGIGVDVILAVNQFKNKLIGVGSVVPGFLSIFSILTGAIRSSPIEAEDACKVLGENEQFSSSSKNTLHELHVCLLSWSQSILGMNFKEAVEAIYRASDGEMIMGNSLFIVCNVYINSIFCN